MSQSHLNGILKLLWARIQVSVTIAPRHSQGLLRGLCSSSPEFPLSYKSYISCIFHQGSAVYQQMEIRQPRQPGQSEL